MVEIPNISKTNWIGKWLVRPLTDHKTRGKLEDIIIIRLFPKYFLSYSVLGPLNFGRDNKLSKCWNYNRVLVKSHQSRSTPKPDTKYIWDFQFLTNIYKKIGAEAKRLNMWIILIEKTRTDENRQEQTRSKQIKCRVTMSWETGETRRPDRRCQGLNPQKYLLLTFSSISGLLVSRMSQGMFRPLNFLEREKVRGGQEEEEE